MSPAPPDTLPPLEARGPSFARRAWNHAMLGGCYLSTALVVLPLGLIVFHLLHKGLPGLTWRSSSTCRSRSASRAAA
jgi:hypothetical protein